MKTRRTPLREVIVSLFILLVIMELSSQSTFARNFYFSSSTGDDSRTSSQAQNPSTSWKTIGKLNSYFASLLPGDSVMFKRGEIFYGQIIISRSGTLTSPIVISAYGIGENPAISGFKELTTWTNLGGNLWQSSFPTVNTVLNQFVINGVQYGMGRYPNNDYLSYESFSGNTSITDNQLSESPNWTGAEAVIRKCRWMVDRNTITSHTAGTLSFTTGSVWGPTAGFGYFIQNDARTLDTFGEWYFDGSAKTVTVFSVSDPSNYSIKASVLDTLVYSARSYISFVNLTFEGSNDNAIVFEHGKGTVVKNCTFNFIGKSAIITTNSSSNATLTIDGNKFIHANQCAITLGNSTTYAWIKNNSIKNIGTIPGMGTNSDLSGDGIEIHGKNSLVEYNLIDSVGHNGITMKTSDSLVVRYNTISNWCMTRYDGGGVYGWCSETTVAHGWQIKQNIILNSNHLSEGIGGSTLLNVRGIYIDEYVQNADINRNSVCNSSTEGIYILRSANLRVRNNTCFDNFYQLGFKYLYGTNLQIRGLEVDSNNFVSRELNQLTLYFESSANDIPSFGQADNNYYARPINDIATIKTIDPANGAVTRTLTQWKAFTGQDVNTQKSSISITNTNDLRFEYNASKANKTIVLPGTYADVKGTIYVNSITLQPYTSAVLIKTTASVNETPLIANQAFSIAENSALGTTVATVVASDPDAAQTKTFSIVSGNTNNAFAINASTGAIAVASASALNFESATSFALLIKVLDNGTPALSSQATVTISVTDVNETPAIANQAFAIAENSALGTTVATVVASDPDPAQTKTFSIVSGNTNNAFAINASTGIITVASASALNFESAPSFALVVKVQDNGTPALSSQATVTISLTDVNETPAIANQAFAIAENSALGTTVATVVASDPDAAQTKTFSIVSGNTNNAFAINASTGIITVASASALNFESAPSFALVIKVQDNGTPALSSQATVTISLTDVNETPAIANQAFAIAENSVLGTTVATVVASDPDAAQTKTFSIVSGNTNNAFAINASTGVITVASASALNFESAPSFALVVKVQDKGTPTLSSQATVTISLTDVNETPAIANQAFAIAENSVLGTTVATVVASDPDAAQTKTFSIVSGNTNTAFAINASTGIITVASASALNFESAPSFALVVKVQDNGTPALSSQAAVTISLTDVNETPAIANQAFAKAENSVFGTTVATVVASDPDAAQTKTFSIVSGNTNTAFAINASTGIITVASASALNFESAPSFALVVKVQDNGTPALSSQATVTISLTDVNETPAIANQAFAIAENSALGTTVATVVASDPDAAQTKTFSIASGNTNNAFAINASTGVITVASASALNFESAPSFALVVKVQENGTPALSSQATVTISLTDVNETPAIANQAFAKAENSVLGTTVATVVASDPDAAQTKTFSIVSGNTNNAFAINASTGIITVASASTLNFESAPSFALVIKVQDNGTPALSSQATVTISLTDVNETPAIANQAFAIAENSVLGTTVATVVASDPDAAQTKTFSIVSGNTNTAFAINASTGVITVANSAALNYESAPSFALVVKVQDNGTPALSSQATVTISLTDVNETPAIANQAFAIAENSALGTTVATVVASDPDAAQTKTFSIVSGNTNTAFAINASTGIITVANSAALDYSTIKSFSIIVSVTDNGTGNLFATATVTINVTQGPNQPPVITDQTFTLNQNAVPGTLVGVVNAIDPDPGQSLIYSIISGNTTGTFSIVPSTGEIFVTNPSSLSPKSSMSFTLTVEVHDNASTSLSNQAKITLQLIHINEPPVILNQTETTLEHQPKGALVGTVSANDPDSDVPVSFNITSGNIGDGFAINPATGVITINNPAVVCYEGHPVVNLNIRVQDNEGAISEAIITINIDDINEKPICSNQIFTIPENEPVQTKVGSASAFENDLNQTLNYSIISGNISNTFSINPGNGSIILDNTSALNFEEHQEFNLIIAVQDNGFGNLTTSDTITIKLIDVNEPPVIVNKTFNVIEKSTPGTIVGDLIASDPDNNQVLTYSIVGGNENHAFIINSSTGMLTVADSSKLSYWHNTLTPLTVMVQDNGIDSLSAIAIITIDIQPAMKDLTDVPSINNTRDISIYPNPTKDIVNVDFGKAMNQPAKIKIFNMAGQEIYRSISNTQDKLMISLENQSAGTYYANITTDEGVYSRQIVVQK